MSWTAIKLAFAGLKAGFSIKKYALIGVGVLIIFGAFWLHGWNTRDNSCNAAALKQELKALKASLENANEIIKKHKKSLEVHQLAHLENERLYDAIPQNDAACLDDPAGSRVRRLGR